MLNDKDNLSTNNVECSDLQKDSEDYKSLLIQSLKSQLLEKDSTIEQLKNKISSYESQYQVLKGENSKLIDSLTESTENIIELEKLLENKKKYK